jgi:hypothetical protein
LRIVLTARIILFTPGWSEYGDGTTQRQKNSEKAPEEYQPYEGVGESTSEQEGKERVRDLSSRLATRDQ